MEILVGLWTFSVFAMLKIIFSKRQLIKIRMTVVYMKSEVKRNDTAMIAAANEACLGWLRENTYLIGKEWHFWEQEM